jgi:hypothetical protein
MAILGHNLSVELKMSRKSLLVFEICKMFQLIIYDLPYINLPATGLLSNNNIEITLKNAKDQNLEI